MYIGRPNPPSHTCVGSYRCEQGKCLWLRNAGREMGDAKPVLVPYYGQPPRNTCFVDKWTPASAGVTNVYREA
ncbi:hypothetical protein HNQ57_002303 [Zhongshania antarctica]|uniref:Uncharacterized protein n=1 Tax=Zhongshania antarctica TaxID=641702 RepID=A0A840R621_9GAMM|nr:hypothetical protein [Zhongshania antarctica]